MLYHSSGIIAISNQNKKKNEMEIVRLHCKKNYTMAKYDYDYTLFVSKVIIFGLKRYFILLVRWRKSSFFFLSSWLLFMNGYYCRRFF